MKFSAIRGLFPLRRLLAADSPTHSLLLHCWPAVAAAALIVSACASDHSSGQSQSGPIPGLFVEGSSDEMSMLVTTERGGEDSFVVRLAHPPLGEVVLSVTGLDPTEADVEPASLSFDNENWNTEQIVMVTGLDDDELDGSQNFSIELDSSQSTDEAYSGMSTTLLSIVNVDNDKAGLTAIDGRMEFSEQGGEGYFFVVLNTPPDDTVTVTVGCADPSEALLAIGGNPAGEEVSLRFSPSNWNTPRRVNLVGQDDGEADGNQVLELTVAVDVDATLDTTGYAVADPVEATVKVRDNETTGIDVHIARACGG